MKKIISFLTAVVLTANVIAQAPNKMSYQTVIRNASGILVNGSVGIQISILQGSASGVSVFVETHTLNTNVNGLASLEIGTGTAVSGTIAGIDWSAGPYFIKTETDPTGGTNYTITGVSELISVPYALSAGNGNWTKNGADIFNSNGGNVGIGTATPFGLAKLEVVGNALINGTWFGSGNNGGVGNVAAGSSLSFNTGGQNNTAIGTEALFYNATGSFNTGVGWRAINNNSTGDGNTAVGTFSQYNNFSGSGNVSIGNRALEHVYSGNNNTAVGNGADVLDSSLTNATAIGAGAMVGASNSVVIGNNANVGIGTSTPAAKLDVAGNVKITDGTEGDGKVLTSDATGLATWKPVNTPAYFRAEVYSTPFTMADAVYVPAAFGDISYLTGVTYSGGDITVPAPGLYHFDISAGTYFPTGIRVNINGNYYSDHTGPVLSQDFYLNTGDFITFLLYQSTGSTQTLDPFAFISCHKVN